jgi:hypothetical protein
METQVWSDVQINVESARAAAKTITALTKASPGVASSSAHGFNNGDILILTIVGMKELHQAVVAVTAKTTDDFEMIGLNGGVIDTTGFGTFVSGHAEKLTFGSVADVVTDVNPSGGESNDIVSTTVHSSQDKSIPGNSAPLVYTLGAQWKPSDPALLEMAKAYATKATRAVEVIFADGSTAVRFAAKPSTTMAPGGSAGGIVTTGAKLNVQGPLSFFIS